jgi:hypothetical protein
VTIDKNDCKSPLENDASGGLPIESLAYRSGSIDIDLEGVDNTGYLDSFGGQIGG